MLLKHFRKKLIPLYEKYLKKTVKKKNDLSTVFLQHFCDKSSVTSCYLLLLVSKKSNFSGEFKLESITNFPFFKKKKSSF